MLKKTDTHILSRILQLDGKDFSPDKARLVLSLEFSPTDCARIERLGRKSSEGTLSPRELAEYESFVRVGDLLATLKSRARLRLRRMGKTG